MRAALDVTVKLGKRAAVESAMSESAARATEVLLVLREQGQLYRMLRCAACAQRGRPVHRGSRHCTCHRYSPSRAPGLALAARNRPHAAASGFLRGGSRGGAYVAAR